MKNKLLILGTFNNILKELPTQAHYLSVLLNEELIDTICISKYKNRFIKALDYIFSSFFYLSKYKIVVIQIYGGFVIYLSIFLSLIYKYILNKKIILTIHGGSIPDLVRRKPQIMKTLFSLADIITAPSNFIKSKIEEFNFEVKLIPNLINFQDYEIKKKLNAEIPYILWMRAYQRDYDPILAVKTFLIIKKKYSKAKMIMAGPDRGMRNDVNSFIQIHNLQNSIEVLGYIDSKKKKEIFKKVNLYLCTNRIDNAPVSFLEMMYCKIPIVSVNVGGIPFLVKNRDTALLSIRSEIELAKNVFELYNDKHLHDLIIKNAHNDIIKNYNQKGIAKKWIDLFEKILPK